MKRYSQKVNKRKPKYDLSFEAVSKLVHGYLKEDGYALNFAGYKEAMRSYFQLHDHDIVSIHEVMVNCNLWYNYFGDVLGFVEVVKEYWLLEADRLFAYEVKAQPSEELENRIQNAKTRAMHFKILCKHLRNQMNFFAKASEHCYRLYQESTLKYSRS